ncbi:hypothetical protein ES689_02430 [Frigoribacterium sp. ACAM 257]|uniref:hypothetical protein n=1 Tax=Frigoribacterium sp. ACAM 257 TaxID=2508998 RepID=UPI0011B97230|nr:hypothetical protein [Frigoribacterium sp. ACAM 257]TWX40343.1 hypothetical protein ES689_02430 [Frigoribacterium sp. ACAM 257]
MTARETGPVTHTAGGTTAPRRRRPRVAFVVVAVVAALFFAYDLYEAITNLVLVPQDVRYQNNEFFDEVGVDGLAATPPWAALVANVLLPVVAWGGALLVARRRPLWQVVLAFVAGLALVGSVSLTITAYVLSI